MLYKCPICGEIIRVFGCLDGVMICNCGTKFKIDKKTFKLIVTKG